MDGRERDKGFSSSRRDDDRDRQRRRSKDRDRRQDDEKMWKRDRSHYDDQGG